PIPHLPSPSVTPANYIPSVFFLMLLPPPRSTLFPYTTLFRSLMVTVCPSQFATRRTLFHVLVGCGLLMLKVSRLKLPEREKASCVRSEERFSRNAETDLVCRLLLAKKYIQYSII